MVYLVTGNEEKYNEFKKFLPSLDRIDLDLEEIQETDAKKIIEHKLEEAGKKCQGQVMVEDTSLYLDCLNGLPGPLIKWFEKKIGNEGLYWLTRSLNNNKARAKTIIGLYDNDLKFFEGSIEGAIVAPKGDKNFGWDPVFKPRGKKKTFAEMTKEEKGKISMRRKALKKLKKHINGL